MATLRGSQATTEATLRRAVRLSVREARNERQERRELAPRLQEGSDRGDARMDRIEGLMKRYFERGGNGRR